MTYTNYSISGNMSLQGIVDLPNLNRVQQRFCRLVGIFAFCMDENGKMITEMSGKEDEVKRIYDKIGMESFLHAYYRICNHSLEEQVVEDTAYSNVKIAFISIKMGDISIVNWCVCGVIEPTEGQEVEANLLEGITTTITEKDFYDALDVLRLFTTQLVQAKFSYANAEAENLRSKSTQLEMSQSIKRIEAVTEIVQLLESEKSIEEVSYEILKTAVSYLQISSGQVCRLNRDNATMDIMSEWCNQGITSIFDKIRNVERPLFLRYEKTYVVSQDTKINSEERNDLTNAHIKAIVAIPIFINGKLSMYVCFNECKQDRIWNVDEIKFMNDASKIFQSVLLKRIQKNSLVSSYASLEAILDHIGCAIYVEDESAKNILFANKILKNNFDKELKENTLDKLFKNGKPLNSNSNNYEVQHIEKERWYDFHFTNINWVDGRKASLCAAYDITDKKVYQRKIEQQAYTDFLTGLYNRMCCERDLAWHIDEAKKCGFKGALLYLDLDDFKHINDGLGHQYGDVLLKAISHSLQRIEGIENTCYRMGGDEFVLIVPPKSYPRFQFIVDAIKDIFSKPWFLKDADYYCTMSMGIVDFPDAGDGVQDLIKKADIAMYEAKKSGKNRVAHYTNNINSTSNKRLDMEKNMRDATADGYREFEVYYQPIIDISLEGNPCTGAEALIRWNSQELGFIHPSEFIPLAEYLGLINPIGNYVLREACMECKYWNESGHPNFKVNVNLSVVQLLQSDIAEIVEKTITEIGISPHNLTLEVTESLAINDMDRMKEILGKIKNLGVRIALDDFGTGYSSLNHIREIPADVIKVDQSFVIDLAEDTYSQSFIKMVAELATSIGVSICVEGIETEEQFKVLEGMQVRMIQGYYFDRPMPKDQFRAKYVFTEDK